MRNKIKYMHKVNVYTSLRSNYTPQAEDPSKARMTTMDIPIC
jgi:hypothetical protein